MWVADTLDDAVVRIDPSTRAVTTTIPVGRAPTGVAVGAGSVWVANSGDGTVTRIDPVDGQARCRTIDVGGSPQGIVVAANRVWVTVEPSTTGAAEAGQAEQRTCASRRTTSTPWIRRSPTSRTRGSSCTRPARSSSTTPTRPARRAPSSYPRSPSRCRPLGRRQDLHVHDPQGLSLLAAVERARHRADVQVHDRAHPEPADEGARAVERLPRRASSAPRPTWRERRPTSPASSRAETR